MRKLSLKALAAAAAFAATTASAVPNQLVVDGVTFSLEIINPTTLDFDITGLLNPSSGWKDAVTFNAFSLGNSGADAVSLTGATVSGNELNANGCSGGGSGKFCFTFDSPLAMADSFSFEITATSGSFSFPAAGPDLKVLFLGQNGKQVGGLLSQPVPAIPEPETYALMLAGLGLVGVMARRRRSA